ncbi:PREDICTED: uncharacterized protein LOC106148990 [Chinchilla lanigera]|uniref:uncharacterized protein LOC106148990 n=1 Tax=Chinchilla lanigera TaxID=34839 RepID=UPI00069859F9|nr:PREDICTED: uncharacterized protein LOC106148990 [Chinchilla lanigera]
MRWQREWDVQISARPARGIKEGKGSLSPGSSAHRGATLQPPAWPAGDGREDSPRPAAPPRSPSKGEPGSRAAPTPARGQHARKAATRDLLHLSGGKRRARRGGGAGRDGAGPAPSPAPPLRVRVGELSAPPSPCRSKESKAVRVLPSRQCTLASGPGEAEGPDNPLVTFQEHTRGSVLKGARRALQTAVRRQVLPGTLLARCHERMLRHWTTRCQDDARAANTCVAEALLPSCTACTSGIQSKQKLLPKRLELRRASSNPIACFSFLLSKDFGLNF